MHDIRALRADPAGFDAALARRALPAVADRLLQIDVERRAALTAVQDKQSRRNALAKQVGQGRRTGVDTTAQEAEATALRDEMTALEQRADALDLAIRRELSHKPGIAMSLEALARWFRARGQAERAARLLGAAAALHDALGTLMLPDWLPGWEVSSTHEPVVSAEPPQAFAALLFSAAYFVKDSASPVPRPPHPITPTLIRSFAPITRPGFIFEAAFENACVASVAPAPKVPVRFKKSLRSNGSEDIWSLPEEKYTIREGGPCRCPEVPQNPLLATDRNRRFRKMLFAHSVARSSAPAPIATRPFQTHVLANFVEHLKRCGTLLHRKHRYQKVVAESVDQSWNPL